MPIEIIVGLPHLSEGPILAQARALQQPALISANGLSRWTERRGWREWDGWRLSQLRNAKGLAALCLDSAGFVAAARYGGFPWSLGDYVALAGAYPFRWWASADYCVEAEIARDREEVIDRLSRTIRANLDCRRLAQDHGIVDTLMPVIQGRRPEDYERCIAALWGSLKPGSLIGVGSMCRRDVHGPEGVIAVIDHLDQILPRGVWLHAFGVKGSALPYLLPFEHRIASIDSQAYGISARKAARLARVSKSDRFVADHMARWVAAQHARLANHPLRLPHHRPAEPDPVPADPWETAIAQARVEIRELIEILNVYADGTLCWGNIPKPGTLSVSAIPDFERALFESWSTHPNHGQDQTVSGKGGLISLWDDLAARRAARFPVRRLKAFAVKRRSVAASSRKAIEPLTLGQLIERTRR